MFYLGVRIYCVCGEGLGSSTILARTVQQALLDLGIEAEVRALAVSEISQEPAAQLILATADLAENLSVGNSELVVIKGIGDLVEIREALSSALS